MKKIFKGSRLRSVAGLLVVSLAAASCAASDVAAPSSTIQGPLVLQDETTYEFADPDEQGAADAARRWQELYNECVGDIPNCDTSVFNDVTDNSQQTMDHLVDEVLAYQEEGYESAPVAEIEYLTYWVRHPDDDPNLFAVLECVRRGYSLTDGDGDLFADGNNLLINLVKIVRGEDGIFRYGGLSTLNSRAETPADATCEDSQRGVSQEQLDRVAFDVDYEF